MKITKFGHCCLLLEVDGVRILTDPGSFTTAQNDIMGLDAVLITHSHHDHYHAESVPQIVKNNPQAVFITNGEVGELLKKEGVAYTKVSDGESAVVKGIKIEGFGKEHKKVYKDIPSLENTGYFVAGKLYFPGDAFYNPHKVVDILALPVAGPWMQSSETIEYAKEICPRTSFPVHDGMIRKEFTVWFEYGVIKTALAESNIEFISLREGEIKEF